MSILAVHIRTRLRDDRVIVESAAQRRTVARVVLSKGRAFGLFAFSLPDQHLHLAARCSERDASELCRRLEISLTKRLALPVGFAMRPHVPIRGQWHLQQVVRYILTQHRHHDVQVDPLRESSNLPDVLGMRLVGGYTADMLKRLWPRLSRARLVSWMGLDRLRPQDGPTDRLLEATCRAAALSDLRSVVGGAGAARRALVSLAGREAAARELSIRLGVSMRTVQRLHQHPADPALVRAIRLQLGAEAALARPAPLVPARPETRHG